MAPSTSQTPSPAIVGRLSRLIVACNDDARAQTTAALVVGGSRGVRLDATAARRMSFAQELAEMVRSFGGRPEEGGSAFEAIRAVVHRANTFVIGENAGDAYDCCARIQAKTEKLYERCARGEMPYAVHAIIARQQVEIAADRAELRRLSMGG